MLQNVALITPQLISMNIIYSGFLKLCTLFYLKLSRRVSVLKECKCKE